MKIWSIDDGVNSTSEITEGQFDEIGGDKPSHFLCQWPGLLGDTMNNT